MIQILAYSINFVILLLFICCGVLAIYLYRKSRELPRKMRDTINSTAREWNLSNLAEGNMSSPKVLEGLRVFVETADAERRAELRGYLKGGDDKSDLDITRINSIRNLAKILTEVFPLLGILGTVASLSVAIGLTGGQAVPSMDMFSDFLSLFGKAVDSTIYGISSAVLFMLVLGAIDGKIEATTEMIQKYRDIIDRALLLSYGLGE